MGAMASQITSLTIVYSTVYSDADQRKHKSSASLAFVRGIHRGPVNCPHKWPVTRKMCPFDDVIMVTAQWSNPGEIPCKSIAAIHFTLWCKQNKTNNSNIVRHCEHVRVKITQHPHTTDGHGRQLVLNGLNVIDVLNFSIVESHIPWKMQ